MVVQYARSGLEKIDGKNTFPAFVLIDRELRFLNSEWGYKEDGPFTLELPSPQIALISGNDGRITAHNGPPYRKFIAFSQTPEKRILTSYFTYKYSGPVITKAWKTELCGLLDNIDMEHFDITSDRVPKKLLARHQERIQYETQLTHEGLKENVEKTFFELLWNVRNC